ncbi:MAG: malate dehydrogenase [Candidatus Omnitrophica bacterium]|nr:malate dehydrogenase [Candidatus Omnitrophota bacterium]MDD5610347.1 malate dehydrogenase [Candidatus Omnitrophota bacterium]
MYKISVIGAGNVGGLAALRLVSLGMGEVMLVDKLKGFAHAKELDLKDSQVLLKQDYPIIGTDDFSLIKDSGIVVITAGLARRPDMTREDLLAKNVEIIKDVSLNVKKFCPEAIVVVVSNPVDILTYAALKLTGIKQTKVFGMGISLDASRFANLIAEELKVSPNVIETVVIGSHGEGMLPLARLTKIKGVELLKFIDTQKVEELVKMTTGRGAQIVSLFGSGSAYVAPSAAIADIVKAIIKDEKRVIGVSCYLNGEYGLKDVYLGTPARIGKNGIEQIIELELNQEEKEALSKSAQLTSKHIENIRKSLN